MMKDAMATDPIIAYFANLTRSMSLKRLKNASPGMPDLEERSGERAWISWKPKKWRKSRAVFETTIMKRLEMSTVGIVRSEEKGLLPVPDAFKGKQIESSLYEFMTESWPNGGQGPSWKGPLWDWLVKRTDDSALWDYLCLGARHSPITCRPNSSLEFNNLPS